MATWLMRAYPYDIAGAAVTEAYNSDTGFITEPGDSPANRYFGRRLKTPMRSARSMYAGTKIGGATETTKGEIVLANVDGFLDFWEAYDWAGRKVQMWYSALDNPTLADFALVATHTVENIAVGDEVRLQLVDAATLLDVPYQTASWLGTGGAEGDAELADTLKPRCLGFPPSVEGVWLDVPNLMIVYGDGSAGGIEKLMDRGVELTAGPDYASYAALLAATMGSYGYLTCDALHIARLAAQPVGPVTGNLAGRTRGATLISNGTFTGNATGWALGTGWAYSSNTAAKTAGTGADLSQTVTTVPGRWYVLKAMITRSAGTLQPKVAGVALGASVNTSRRIVRKFKATGASTAIAFTGDSLFAGTVDDVVVIEVLTMAADLVELVVTTDTSLTSASDFRSGTLAAFQAACPQPLGHWSSGKEGFRLNAVIDQIVNSVGGWWGFDLSDDLQLGLFAGPAVAADFTFAARDIISCEPIQRPPRAREQVIEFLQRWRAMADSDVAASITGASRATLIRSVEVARAKDATTKTQSLRSTVETRRSLMIQRADAAAEASRLLALFAPQRYPLEVRVPYTPGLDIGQTVSITWPRHNLAGGELALVLRAEPDVSNKVPVHVLTVWY